MVGVAKPGRDTDWISINEFFQPGKDTIVAFASFNRIYGSSRSFSIRQDETSVWGFESSGGAEWTLNYAQQVAIHPNGKVEQLKPSNLTRKLLPGKFYVRLQSIQDIGGVLVNGQPAGVYWNEAGGWTDITNMVYADQDNKVTFSAWNFEDVYVWDFAIKHDDTIIWSKTGSGSGALGKVFEESVTINTKGLVNESQPSGKAIDHVWSVIAYRADDAAAVFANGELVGVAVPGRNTDWIGINEYLKPDQDTVLAFAGFNRIYGSSRGFAIRRDDTIIWGYESDGGAEWTLNYAQQMVIHPDGSIERIKADTSIRKPPPGKWFVRIQNVQDIGAVLVNGQPVAVYWNEAGNWIDVTNLLYSNRDNKIVVAAWNFEDVYAWDFAIKRDDEILWQVTNNGTGQAGKVFSAEVIITGNGELYR